jgi:hypothetical protein
VGDGSDDDGVGVGTTGGEADSGSGVGDKVKVGVLLLDSSEDDDISTEDCISSLGSPSLLVLATSSVVVVESSTCRVSLTSCVGSDLSSCWSTFKPKISEEPPPGGRSTLLLLREFGLNPENIRVEFAAMVGGGGESEIMVTILNTIIFFCSRCQPEDQLVEFV